jgi:cyanate lyase
MTSYVSVTDEIWKPIPGYEQFYEISDLGRVRRKGNTPSCKHDRMLKPNQRKNAGYVTICLSKENKKHGHYLHQLVLLSFQGECPKGYQVNHKNEDKGDNRLANLEYVTAAQNTLHSRRTLGHHQGSRNAASKLTEQQVLEMRYKANVGSSYENLAREYGLAHTTVCAICYGDTWQHVGGPLSNRGDKSPGDHNRKLTHKIVAEMKQKRQAGATYVALAAEYGVNRVTVKSAVTGKTWNSTRKIRASKYQLDGPIASEIRSLAKQGMTQKALSQKFGIPRGVIGKIVHSESHADMERVVASLEGRLQ